jgi:hypothetical protein
LPLSFAVESRVGPRNHIRLAEQSIKAAAVVWLEGNSRCDSVSSTEAFNLIHFSKPVRVKTRLIRAPPVRGQRTLPRMPDRGKRRGLGHHRPTAGGPDPRPHRDGSESEMPLTGHQRLARRQGVRKSRPYRPRPCCASDTWLTSEKSHPPQYNEFPCRRRSSSMSRIKQSVGRLVARRTHGDRGLP